MPLLWVYHPPLLVKPGSDVVALIWYLPIVLIAIIVFSASQIGYLFRPLRLLERLVLFAGGALLIVPLSSLSFIVAGGLILLILFIFKGKAQHG